MNVHRVIGGRESHRQQGLQAFGQRPVPDFVRARMPSLFVAHAGCKQRGNCGGAALFIERDIEIE
jgi:hypothetical protein